MNKPRNRFKGLGTGQEARIYAPYTDTPRKTEPISWGALCVANGENNDYSERVENFIEHSINATSVSGLFKRFLIGQGDPKIEDKKANDKQTFDELINDIADEYKDHKGFYVLVKYNAEGKKKQFKSLPFTSVRIKSVDSKGNPTKFIVSNDWQSYQKEFSETKDYSHYEFHTYNPKAETVIEQIKDTKGGFSKYKGQIFYYNGGKAKYNYPLAFIHPVLNDCDSDFRIQLHRNKRIRGGFLNKKILITPPEMPSHLNFPDESLDAMQLAEKRDFEKNQTIANRLQEFLGAENNEGFLHLCMEFEQDDIDKLVKVIDIQSVSEDGIFEKNEETIKKNLRAAYFNPPPILLDSDNSFFGSSGEAMREAMEFYEKNVNHEKIKFKKALKNCFDFEFDLIGLLEDVNKQGTEDVVEEIGRDEQAQEEIRKAQATLRGSVGGVTALLQIQKSVADDVTSPASGLQMLDTIYGFDPEVAKKILGTVNEGQPKTQGNE